MKTKIYATNIKEELVQLFDILTDINWFDILSSLKLQQQLHMQPID